MQTPINDPLRDAVEFAIAHETRWARTASPDGSNWGIHAADPPPWNRLLGPISPRGPCSGLVLQNGREVAAWGEPDRADLTFSIAKTYLALLAGVAHDRGLLPDPDEPVVRRVRGIGFEGAHNGAVTWTQLLQQTSEWEGSCFGVPDQVDRYRVLSFEPPGTVARGRKGDPRPLQAPGSYWEYNDVRINQLSLALLHLFRRPLPEVFAEAIMGPVGASDDWSWRGYDHAWVDIDGRRMQSVPGGTHWGGGVTISARDQVRIGRMLLGRGALDDRRVLSEDWVTRMLAPCPIAPFYGYLTWLNGTREVFPAAPQTSFFAIGAGTSITWVDPPRALVAVVRWIDAEAIDGFAQRLVAALDAGAGAS